MTYKGETLERALDTLIQANISSALTTVAARWAAIDAVTLPVPVNYTIGYRTLMVELPSTYFPYVVMIVAEGQPRGGSGRLDVQDVDYPFSINAFVVADTEAEVAKVAHRYAEAIVDILEGSRVIGGCRQTSDKPIIQIYSDDERHLKNGYYGDQQDTDDVDYVRLVVVNGTLRD